MDQRGLWSDRERLGMQQDEGCMAGALRLWLLGAEERPCVQLRARRGVPPFTRCVSVRPRPLCVSTGREGMGGGRGRCEAVRVLRSSASDGETPVIQLFETVVGKWRVSENF